MGPDAKDTFSQLSKDVGSSMQMVVVTVVATVASTEWLHM